MTAGAVQRPWGRSMLGRLEGQHGSRCGWSRAGGWTEEVKAERDGGCRKGLGLVKRPSLATGCFPHLFFFWALPLSQELCRVLGRVQASKSSTLHLGLLGLRSWTPGEALGLSLGPETCSESLWKQNTPLQHPAASLLEMILNFFSPQGD